MDRNGWIKCSERMPEDGMLVLAHVGEGKRSENLVQQDAKTAEWVKNPYAERQYTHWQPLPAPPEPEISESALQYEREGRN